MQEQVNTARIIELKAKNVKRLRAIQITPEGNLVVIGGNNAQGKSSTLDAILYGLAGKGPIGKAPLRKGEDKGFTELDLGDLRVKRTFTASGGGTLTVKNKDGASYKSPQAILDALVGPVGFDPLAFASAPDARQLELLKALVGLDFTAQDAERKRLYDERTAVNREHKSAVARYQAAPSQEVPADTQAERVDVAALMKELEKAQEINKTGDQCRERLASIQRAIVARNAEINNLENKLAEMRAEVEKWDRDERSQQANVAGLVEADEKSIRAKIASAQAVNDDIRDHVEARAAATRANEEKARLKTEADRKHAEAEALSAKIEAVDKAKADALAGATFPVPGLSFDESGVLYQGIPFSEASQAEKIRVSVAMGLAMHPRLRVLLIRDGSLLDADNLKVIAEIAAEHDAQVWMERVGKGEECQVIIEDGMVEARGPAQATVTAPASGQEDFSDI